MKKSIFLIAAMAGALFTACTSEENLTLDNPGKQASANVAVGFDTYLNQATQTQTRAGLQDVMTNAKLQYPAAEAGGFGVFAVHHNNSDWAADKASNAKPNFMWNQGVFYSESAWGYTPLKYWPNETFDDSQVTPAHSQSGTVDTRDKVSFFAYAPYVNFTASAAVSANYPNASAVTKFDAIINYTDKSGAAQTTASETGITAVTKNTHANGAAKVYYKVKNTKPEESVDLLWGVAPAGGMNYTAVNGNAISKPTGLPLTDLEKPSENQKIKFNFQHALSRLSLSIVAAVDQIGPGGTLTDAQGNITRINVESVKVKADKFNTGGWLDLENPSYSNRANWYHTETGNYTYETEDDYYFIMSDATLYGELGAGAESGNKLLNETIWDNGGAASAQTEGVTVTEKPLMNASVDPAKKKDGSSSMPTFTKGTTIWKENASTGNAQEILAKNGSAIAVNTLLVGDPNGTLTGVKAMAADELQLSASDQTNYYEKTALTAIPPSSSSLPASYYVKTTDGVTGIETYVKTTTAGIADVADKYYTGTPTPVDMSTYVAYPPTAEYYTGTLPRYWMIIPAYYDGTDVQSTDVTVQITYYVTTDDSNLAFNGDTGKKYSRVQNIIEKTVPVKFESGKSYNLKLILGLTSVKLDAEVADWKLAGDTEVNLPQNVE